MADLAPMQTARTIIALEHDAQGVALRWDDGLRSRFHVLWLRDNCPCPQCRHPQALRSEEHTSELQSQSNLVCRLLLEKKNSRSPRASLPLSLPTHLPRRPL